MRASSSGTRVLAVMLTVMTVVTWSLSAVDASTSAVAATTAPTTAWSNGAFVEDVAGLVGRSDVVLGSPNYAPDQSLPLGNGALGAATWAANGFTAQLNRDDTLPDREALVASCCDLEDLFEVFTGIGR